MIGQYLMKLCTEYFGLLFGLYCILQRHVSSSLCLYFRVIVSLQRHKTVRISMHSRHSSDRAVSVTVTGIISEFKQSAMSSVLLHTAASFDRSAARVIRHDLPLNARGSEPERRDRRQPATHFVGLEGPDHHLQPEPEQDQQI